MNSDNYFEQRNILTLNRLKSVMKELPKFCLEFFIGIESRTSPLTRLHYAYDLRIFFAFLVSESGDFDGISIRDFGLSNLESVTTTNIEMYVSYLSNFEYNGVTYSNSPTTKSRKLSSVRSMFKYLFNKDKITKDVASKVELPKLHNKPIIRLEGDELGDMLNEAESGAHLTERQKSYHNNTKLRDTAIVTLFLGTGIRISELVGLNVTDIDFYNSAFKVTRKGGDQEILFFNEEVSLAVLEYIECERENYVQGDIPALFLSMQKKRITVRAVENLVKKYAVLISPLKKITPHKLRSTFGTNLYRETNDIYVVAEVLGHKDVNVTKKHYADISDDIKRKASLQVKLRKSTTDVDKKNDDDNYK